MLLVCLRDSFSATASNSCIWRFSVVAGFVVAVLFACGSASNICLVCLLVVR